MLRPYNTAKCGAAAGVGVDNAYTSMFVVDQLSRFTDVVRKAMCIVPVVYPGLYDRDTDEMIRAAVLDWGVGEETNIMIAGQHVEAGQRHKLTEDHLKGLLQSWGTSMTPVTQVEADMTPHQAV